MECLVSLEKTTLFLTEGGVSEFVCLLFELVVDLSGSEQRWCCEGQMTR